MANIRSEEGHACSSVLTAVFGEQEVDEALDGLLLLVVVEQEVWDARYD